MRKSRGLLLDSDWSGFMALSLLIKAAISLKHMFAKLCALTITTMMCGNVLGRR